MKRPASETVCALATPPGTGSIAVVRVSGPGTFAALDRLFPGIRPSRQRSHTVRLGWAVGPDGTRVDQALVTAFRAPRSYTGEDMAEISCHGGAVAARLVLDLLAENGCRPAEPGDFTRRAVLAGKLSLTQAEAVLELVNARTPGAFRGALDRYQGALARVVAGFEEELKDVTAGLEHHLGFDETDSPWPPDTRPRTRTLYRRLDAAVRQAERARRLDEEPRIAIVGRPNVGKSTLFNRLVGEERAVVSPRPGTTRDRVEARLELGSARVTLVDTGGVAFRAAGTIARAAGRQTRRALEQADLVLAVFDGSLPPKPADRRVVAACPTVPVVYVLNKQDAGTRFPAGFFNGSGRPVVGLSALTGRNVGRLRSMLAARFRAREDGVVANPRQLEMLRACRDAVGRSAAAPDAETAAFELRAALDALGEVDGPAPTEELLDRVFAGFCVGK